MPPQKTAERREKDFSLNPGRNIENALVFSDIKMQKFCRLPRVCLFGCFVCWANSKQTNRLPVGQQPTSLSPPPAPCPSCDLLFAVLFPSGRRECANKHATLRAQIDSISSPSSSSEKPCFYNNTCYYLLRYFRLLPPFLLIELISSVDYLTFQF